MAETWDNLVGAWENVDYTIKFQIKDKWVPENCNNIIPIFVSASEKNTDRVWAANKATPGIYFNLGDKTEIDHSAGYGKIFYQQDIYIDAFAHDVNDLILFTNEIDRILRFLNPNSGSRVTKSTGSSSVIGRFANDSLNWIKAPPLDKDARRETYSQMSAILGCQYSKTMT